MKLRNVVSAVAQFRTALGDQHVRRPSLYSSSDDPEYDEQSVDSIMDACTFEGGNGRPVAVANHSIIVDNDVQRLDIDSTGNRVVRLSSQSTSKENIATDRLVVHEEAVAASEHVATIYFLSITLPYLWAGQLNREAIPVQPSLHGFWQ